MSTIHNPFAKGLQNKKANEANKQLPPQTVPLPQPVPTYPAQIPQTNNFAPPLSTIPPPPINLSDALNPNAPPKYSPMSFNSGYAVPPPPLENEVTTSPVTPNGNPDLAPPDLGGIQPSITVPSLNSVRFTRNPKPHNYTPQAPAPPPEPPKDMSDGNRIKQYEYKTKTDKTSNQRVDPRTIPRPSLVTEKVEFQTSDLILPPLSTRPFTALDNGVCNPRFVRSTLYRVPTTRAQAIASGLPFSIVVHPLAELTEEEGEVPMIDFDLIGSIRCKKCLAYVNPFFKFRSDGTEMQCNICNTISPVPVHYVAPLDSFGKRVDVNEHPELLYGSYDLLVADQFKARAIQRPIYVFAINNGYISYKSGWFQNLIAFLKECIHLLESVENAEVVILSYSDTINYYYLNNDKIKVYVVCDNQEGFTPLPYDKFKISIKEIDKINMILDSILAVTEEYQSPSNCLGSCLESLYDLLQVDGGRVLIFHGSSCNTGSGSVTYPSDPCNIYGREDEKAYYTPEDDNFYYCRSTAFNNKDTRVDIFAFGSDNYLRLCELGQIPTNTGGHLYYYPEPSLDSFIQFHSDLYTTLSAPHVFEPILKIRVSEGLNIVASGYLGEPGYEGCKDQLDLGGCDYSQSWNIDIEHKSALKDNDYVYIQAALLYTAINQKRYIRVHNLRLNTTTQINEVFSNCDIECIVNCMLKKCVLKLYEKNLYDARYYPFDQCVEILTSYRKNCASTTPEGQLVLPDCLKTLPLYTMCMLKSALLRMNNSGLISYKDVDVRADVRAYEAHRILAFNVHTSVLYLYPYLFDLSCNEESETNQIPVNYGEYDDDGVIILPNLLWPSSSSLEYNKYYLLFNGNEIYIFVNHSINPDIYRQLSGVETLEEFQNTQLYVNESVLSQNLFNVIEYLRKPFEQNIEIKILSSESPNAKIFYNCLVEDKQGISSSYVDYICTLHQRIKQKL